MMWLHDATITILVQLVVVIVAVVGLDPSVCQVFHSFTRPFVTSIDLSIGVWIACPFQT